MVQIGYRQPDWQPDANRKLAFAFELR